MNKRQLINELANSFWWKENAKFILEIFINTIKDQLLSWSEVSIQWFGKFLVNKRKAKNWVNPKTLEKILIDSYSTPVFKAGETFKREIKEKFSK